MGFRKVPFVRSAWKRLHSYSIPDYPVLLNTEGIKLLANPSKHGPGWILLAEGTYEPFTTALFKKLLTRKGMVFVDLGASVGYFSMIAAKLVGNSGRVYAFEPEPSSFDLLVKNAKLNGFENIVPVPKAVSNCDSVTNIFIPPRETPPSESPHVYQIFSAHDGYESVSVQTVSLDSFFKDKNYSVDFIKMDIEGAEVLALQGMANVIEKNRGLKIITEFNPEYLKRAGASPLGYLATLMEYGFRLYRINEKQKTLDPILDAKAEVERLKGLDYENILAER